MSDHTSPPRETYIRAVSPGLEFVERADAEYDLPDGSLGLLRVLFSPVNEWAHIRSEWEGDFMERFAPGAWKKTIRERGAKILSLFQHGHDPQIGDKPLGPVMRLEEGENGGYGEVALLDTSYNRDLLPSLKANLLGASHRFAPLRYTDVDHPEPSEANPNGIKERTIKEARLAEFGPVTWPAYEGATAGVRSLTDEFLIDAIRMDPIKAREMFDRAISLEDISPASEQDKADDQQDQQEDAPSRTDAAPARTSDTERRVTANGKGPLALPTRTEQAGLTLTTERKANQWPIP
jgi:HK97 family phage prohead protease